MRQRRFHFDSETAPVVLFERQSQTSLTRLIQRKVCVHGEGGLHGPALEQLGHDLLLLGRDAVRVSACGGGDGDGGWGGTHQKTTCDYRSHRQGRGATRQLVLEVCTQVLVLPIGGRVSVDAPLFTLGGLLLPVAGRASPVHAVLAGSDAVGSAACKHAPPSFQLMSVTCFRYSIKKLHGPTHRWSRRGLPSPGLCLPRTAKQQTDNRPNTCVHERNEKKKH